MNESALRRGKLRLAITTAVVIVGCLLVYRSQFVPGHTKSQPVLSNSRIETLLQDLEDGVDGIDPDLYSGWSTEAQSMRELIVMLQHTPNAEKRYAIEEAINIITGATTERHEQSRSVLQELMDERDPEIKAVVSYMLAPDMLENDHSDTGNLLRLEFCLSDVEVVRWLAVRDLSMAHRNYMIESDNSLLFLNSQKTERLVIATLKHHLSFDRSAAVRLAALDGLWWYFQHSRVTRPSIEQAMDTALRDPQEQVRRRASEYLRETQLLKDSSSLSNGTETPAR